MSGYRLSTFLKQLWRQPYFAFIHLILPHFCLICKTTELKSNHLICQACWENLPPADSSDRLLIELTSNLSGQVCFSRVFSLWQFSPAAQTIIHFLKYRYFKNLALKIGKAMAQEIIGKNVFDEKTILIPVPLHRTRLRERGYNQSYLICQSLAAETGFAIENFALTRIRYTASQTNLTAKQRQHNVKNAFAVIDREKIVGKTILLVDDVITTGATMNACARELMLNGAKEIILLSAVKA